MKRLTGESCENCVYWHRSNGAVGYCYRMPPTPIPVGAQKPMIEGQPPQLVVQSHWPPLHAQQWCGEHQHDRGAAMAIDWNSFAKPEGKPQ